MSRAQTCDATKGGCGNHFLCPTWVFAKDGSGPLDYDAPLVCWGCNSIYLPLPDGSGYQRYANMTALAVLRKIQPPPGTFD